MVFFKFINNLFAFFFPFYITIKDVKVYYNSLDRLIACILWKFDLLEGYEIKLFHSFLNENSIVFDIGANMGLYCLTASKKVKNGKIYAFEPDVQNFCTLEKSIRKNNFKNIELFPYAVSDKDELIYIEKSSFNSGNHQIRKQNTSNKFNSIQAISLDNFIDNKLKVDIIKIDIQGAEYFALKGMEQIIKNNPNVIIFAEYWIQGMKNIGINPNEYIDFLNNNNFNIYQIDNKNNCLHQLKYDEILTNNHMDKFFLNFIITKITL